MKALRLANIGVLLLASAVLCYGQHGRGGSAGGHMGGPENSGSTSDHGSKAGSTQSQKPTLQDQLDDHSKLTANLQKLLPTGTTPQQACQGFKNLGQCVAAIHVAHNLGITPFSDLAGKLTGPNRESLGKAIQQLRPQANAGAEKKKAEKQAKADLNGSAS